MINFNESAKIKWLVYSLETTKYCIGFMYFINHFYAGIIKLMFGPIACGS